MERPELEKQTIIEKVNGVRCQRHLQGIAWRSSSLFARARSQRNFQLSSSFDLLECDVEAYTREFISYRLKHSFIFIIKPSKCTGRFRASIESRKTIKRTLGTENAASLHNRLIISCVFVSSKRIAISFIIKLQIIDSLVFMTSAVFYLSFALKFCLCFSRWKRSRGGRVVDDTHFNRADFCSSWESFAMEEAWQGWKSCRFDRECQCAWKRRKLRR